MDVAIVILNYNDSENVFNLVNQIDDYKTIKNIIIVDNCSTDSSFAKLQKIVTDKIILLRTDKNGGYGYGNNVGVKYAFYTCGCTHCLIANPDIEFSEDVLVELYRNANELSSCAVISCIQDNVHFPETRSAWKLPKSAWNYIFNAGWILRHFTESLWYEDEWNARIVPVGCVQGAMLLVDCEKFLSFGGYDEDIFLYCEETSLGMSCYRNGFYTYLDTALTYRHYHSQSVSKAIPLLRKQKQMAMNSKRIIVRKNWKLNVVSEVIMNCIFAISVFEQTIAIKRREKK